MTEDPLNAIETMNAVSDMAKMMRVFYRELVHQGFTTNEALALTMTYLTAALGPLPPRSE